MTYKDDNNIIKTYEKQLVKFHKNQNYQIKAT
jgi:hypothetical protein